MPLETRIAAVLLRILRHQVPRESGWGWRNGFGGDLLYGFDDDPRKNVELKIFRHRKYRLVAQYFECGFFRCSEIRGFNEASQKEPDKPALVDQAARKVLAIQYAFKPWHF